MNLVLLVGGFGESEYLYQRTRAWATPLGIQVLQPRDAATAVVQGAVLRGLEPKEAKAEIKTKLSRRARRCYGVVTKQEFNPNLHWEQDSWIDPVTHKKYARHQIHWFIKTVRTRLLSFASLLTHIRINLLKMIKRFVGGYWTSDDYAD